MGQQGKIKHKLTQQMTLKLKKDEQENIYII